MDFRDYYEILGVPAEIDDKVIRQAFRQLAYKVHLDVNPGNKVVEEKFRTIYLLQSKAVRSRLLAGSSRVSPKWRRQTLPG
jgi:preprotein translocase subunit Sec63